VAGSPGALGDLTPFSGIAECSTTVAAAETGGGVPVDFSALAEEARASLRLPVPEVAAAPPLNARQVVHVPMWMWVAAEQWAPVSAEAAVSGGSVSVTATPTGSAWSMGDGSTVRCEGSGEPFDPSAHTAGAESPTCGHTFRSSSAHRPGGRFPVVVDVTWEVAWESSTGESGVLDPLVMSAQAETEVVEVRALVTEA
jgi:hypothetical protein